MKKKDVVKMSIFNGMKCIEPARHVPYAVEPVGFISRHTQLLAVV